MNFVFTDAQLVFQRDVYRFLKESVSDDLKAEVRRLNVRGPATAEFWSRFNQRGWLGASWPTEYGGLGRSKLHEYILSEALEFHEAPPIPLVVTSLGPTLMRVGTEEQKRLILPGIIQGVVDIALGYSEPNAGSDLSAITTKAVPSRDGFIIKGLKSYTSIAHYSTYIWLAARTNDSVPRHRGISIFLVPTNAPGVTIRPVWTIGEGRLNDVFLDDVYVPRESLVGEIDKGWYYMMMALDFERSSLAPYSLLMRLLQDLLEHMKTEGPALREKKETRHRLAEMMIRVQVAKVLAFRTAWLIDRGETPQYEAHIQKLHRSETLQLIVSTGMALLGLRGQLLTNDKRAVLSAKFPQFWQLAVRTTIGAGTSEVLRTTIASRGLGLPR